MWRAPTYNDGNGCGGVAQAQRRPIHILEVPAANGVRGGIVMCWQRGELCKNFSLFFFFILEYMSKKISLLSAFKKNFVTLAFTSSHLPMERKGT